MIPYGGPTFYSLFDGGARLYIVACHSVYVPICNICTSTTEMHHLAGFLALTAHLLICRWHHVPTRLNAQSKKHGHDMKKKTPVDLSCHACTFCASLFLYCVSVANNRESINTESINTSMHRERINIINTQALAYTNSNQRRKHQQDISRESIRNIPSRIHITREKMNKKHYLRN